MHVVVLSVDPADGNPQRWRRGLAEAGVSAEVLSGCPDALPAAALVISHVLLAERATPHPVWDAARRYEAAGTPLTNSTACLARCADKWLTHRAWEAAGLPQPRTWRLEELDAWPEVPALVKPAFGESARGIAVVADLRAAREAAGATRALVQEVVPCRSVLRVHATDRRVLGAHARPAAAIPGLPAPDAVERAVPITDELSQLAVAAVRAVGGGLVGLDVIETSGGYVLLEANPAFSVPVHLPELMRALVRAALDLA